MLAIPILIKGMRNRSSIKIAYIFTLLCIEKHIFMLD
jgi:hypothetical protein